MSAKAHRKRNVQPSKFYYLSKMFFDLYSNPNLSFLFYVVVVVHAAMPTFALQTRNTINIFFIELDCIFAVADDSNALKI